MQNTTIVFYNIINDKEDKNSQNVFYISKPPNLITLSDIKNEFPLEGTYHFRFKINHNNNTVWVDITDGFSHVPTFNSCIYMKVLRLSWINNKNDKTSLNDKTVNVHSLTPSYENDKTIFEENRPNIHDSTDANKSKTNIDMLLFETTPNKTTRVNLEDKKEYTKDQNYFDLMFN
ncbi:conserved Plasmodium protein, unknown function [Plasmodium berghei]|uniref:DIX domain-containing protein, putative n=2 Tax=Plasmodium berghei TaxID=5821 RepID=A0A509AMY7_PLABA|nr:DIX domain-containing protein, putative [Plasmodium berghei ANKA]CXI53251.1 conserved Plasmodium protein, unknown function [Plasmodium berghei]SCL94773.1 conserved Plasmodium protein, unknown function [Plasmodium berghei]SCM16097.1 conserved Plasmodium protein, unknown function [Plasmodium berghei]SCM17893.1 conserved Plasmodium protein, unknown function [Plasmodium berghei]SCN26222.1 conserved Plasmodium protein, unknown function [Plasmodium berghei]|eukprot:XP_034422021.1 DIX domain-containing protein, putative [Plasmodium berghei ANKA]